MGDFTVNVRQKPMDFNRWQLGFKYENTLLVLTHDGAASPEFVYEGVG